MTSANARPAVEAVIAGYLGNYEARRSTDDGKVVVFGKPEADLLVALLYRRLDRVFTSPVARAVCRREVDGLVRQELSAPSGRPETNLAGFVASGGLDDSGPTIDGALPRLVRAGASRAAVKGSFGIVWRALFLVSAREDPRIEGEPLDSELQRWIAYLSKRTADETPRPLHQISREAFALAEIGRRLGETQLVEHAAQAVQRVSADQRHDGSLPSQVEAGAGAAGAAAATPHLGQFLLAAWATNRLDPYHRLLEFLLSTRLDPEKQLLFAGDREEGRYDSTPWLPLALVPIAKDPRPLDAVLDPPVPPPPAFEISPGPPHAHHLSFEVSAHGKRRERTVDAQDLNLVLGRVLHQAEAQETSARQHAHMSLALQALLDQCREDETGRTLARVLGRSLATVVATQEANGGWAYGHQAVASVVFSAGRKTKTNFPDLQYTIDAAVPGIALTDAYRRTGEQHFLEAAGRAFSFFEEHIGRVTWKGQPVWRLYPEDVKTEAQGTAVNYELWSGVFFAALAQATPNSEVGARARSYVEDVLTYSLGHLYPNGDIAYGDYVGERRTAYASWDAFLLAEIAERIGSERAAQGRDTIVRRLAELVLPSGAMPNVADHRDEVGELTRWSIHRHGVGPYPIRSYYQSYFVVAAGLAEAEPEAPLKAFGFVMLHLFEDAFSTISSGYAGDGQRERLTSEFRAADWLLLSVASLRQLSSFEYEPSLGNVRSGRARLRRSLERLAEDCEIVEEEEAPSHAGQVGGGTRLRGDLAAFGIGLTALLRSSGDPHALRRAVRLAQVTARGVEDPEIDLAKPTVGGAERPTFGPVYDQAVACQLLLRVADLTSEEALLAPAGAGAHRLAQALVPSARLRSAGPPLGDLPYWTVAHAAGAVGAVAQALDDPRLGAARDHLCHLLVEAQSPDGLWSYSRAETVLDAHHGPVLTGLIQAWWTMGKGRRELRRAIRLGVQGARKQLFDAYGRGRQTVNQPGGPMWSHLAAHHALAFTQGGMLLSSDRFVEYGQTTFKSLLNDYGTVTGGLALTSDQTWVDERCLVDAFASLALLFELDPPWLDDP